MVKCGKVGYQPGAISAGIALIESCLTNKVFVRACVRRKWATILSSCLGYS